MQKYFAFFKKFLDFFRQHGDDDRSLMEKLRDKYRLVVMNDETFEEVTSLKLSPLNVYVFFSSLMVGTAIVVTLLIVYTPLKRYIPGYGDYNRDQEISELRSKVNGLEEEAEASRRYNENFRKILVGDMEDMGKEAAEKQVLPDGPNDSLPDDVDRIPEDDQLRAAVAKGTFSTGPEAANAAAASPLPGSRDLPLEKMSFLPPVSGEMTAPFDLSKKHFGIDVAAPKNTAVKATADGVVISSEFNVETGYTIAIQHPNNVVTMYKHNSVLLKSVGANVKAGEAIAMIGNTGIESSGPHLHFELWYRGRAVDPSDYMNF